MPRAMRSAEGYALTYRVTDVDGDAVTLRFAIRVNGIPSFVREEEDQLYTAGNDCLRVWCLMPRLERFRVRRSLMCRILPRDMR
jgi:hypothetical protein